MVLTEIPINWSAFESASSIDFNLTNLTSQELMNRIPESANTITGGYYAIVVLMVIGIFLYWLFTDKTQFGYFKYSEIRGIGISLGIISILGIVMLSVGFAVHFQHIAMLITLHSLSVLYTFLKNPS